jgi:hypothetical protein
VTRGRGKRQAVSVLRPGSHFDFRRGRLAATSAEPFEWPFSFDA